MAQSCSVARGPQRAQPVLTTLGLPPARVPGGGQDVLHAVAVVGVRQPRVTPAAPHAPLEEKGHVEATILARPEGKTLLQTPKVRGPSAAWTRRGTNDISKGGLLEI